MEQGRRRETGYVRTCLCVCEKGKGEGGRLLRIRRCPQCMDVCSWYDIWPDLNLLTNTHTHLLTRRCAHTANSSCSNKALTASQSWSLLTARGTSQLLLQDRWTDCECADSHTETCVFCFAPNMSSQLFSSSVYNDITDRRWRMHVLPLLRVMLRQQVALRSRSIHDLDLYSPLRLWNRALSLPQLSACMSCVHIHCCHTQSQNSRDIQILTPSKAFAQMLQILMCIHRIQSFGQLISSAELSWLFQADLKIVAPRPLYRERLIQHSICMVLEREKEKTVPLCELLIVQLVLQSHQRCQM